MKIIRLLPFMSLGLVIPAMAYAETPLDLASDEGYQMQYPFSPPSIFTPQTDLTTPVENQFDYKPTWLPYSVAQTVASNTTNPLHITSYFSGHSNLQRALLRHRGSHYYVIGQAYHFKLNDYHSAKGDKVNVGYDRQGQLFMLGYLPSLKQEYRVGIIHDRIIDDKQPQHQMDAVDTQRLVLTGMIRLGEQDQSNTFNLNIRHVQLDRYANNFELRQSPNSIKMDVERRLLDIRADYSIDYGDHRSQFGLKYGEDTHNAMRFVRTSMGFVRNAYRFPDIHSRYWHVFYDHIWKLNEHHKLSLGLSYDWLQAEAKKRNETAKIGVNNFPSPNQAWRMHYGYGTEGKQLTHGVGFALQYDYQPSDLQYYQLGFDSRLRQPQNAERYTGLIGPNGMGWLGNPLLKPERHNRGFLQTSWQGDGWKEYGKVKGGDVAGSWKIALKADYDKVHNFIIFDRARGQSGVVAKNNNIISRNINATLISAELDIAKSLTSNLATRLNLRYQYGENNTDSRPIYHVRPFSLDMALDWLDYTSFGSYNLGASLHYSHKNTRLDSDKTKGLGLDNPLHYQSYAVVNLYGGVQLHDRISLTAGVQNLFNRQYYAFNENPHVAALTPIAVAAPERTYWIAFNLNF